MLNPMSLEGHRLLVTGASSGIGRACAIMASQLGADVVLVARRAEALEETRQMMTHPETHTCIAWDLAQLETYDDFFKKVLEGGKLSGLIHAAGIGPALPVGMLNMDDVRKVFDLNTLSFLALMKHCSKKRVVVEKFSGVAISSISAYVGWGGGSVYSASKAALSAAVRCVAVELAPKGYRINAVCPSNIRTAMYEETAVEMHNEAGLKKMLTRQPLGLGKPEQVASAVCFLLSDAASFITGVNLPVDGGYLAQ